MRKLLVVAVAVTALGRPLAAQQTPRVIYTDPPRDSAHPARMEVLHIPSGGVSINGVAYLASGRGAHPTFVFFHGLPGNEKNLDLAQAVRRAGWHAITVNYRGSWGSPGEFRFGNNLEDADAVLGFLRDTTNSRRLGVDTNRMVIAGHSMGGWVTAHTAAHHPELLGAILISAADIGRLGAMPRGDLARFMADNMESLAGVTAEGMADDILAGASRWTFDVAAPGLARVPLLVLTSNDGLASHTDPLVHRLRELGNTSITSAHRETDHSWSDKRIALQTLVIAWLEKVRRIPRAQVQSSLAPLVDHHQHLFSPIAVALPPARARGVKSSTAADLVAELYRAGIKRGVVLSLGYQYGNPSFTVDSEYAKVKAENDWTSQQVSKYPERLVAFCAVNPLRDYALDEIARCANDPQLRRGLKLHFGNSDVQVHDSAHVARLRRVFQSANQHGMAIVVHMHANINRSRPYGRAEALIFLNEILPSAPDVPVQIAHLAGAGNYSDSVDAALGVFVDAIAANDPRTRRLLFDASIMSPSFPADRAPRVATRIRQLGLARVLYGSDTAPGTAFGPREAWAAFRTLPLTEAEFRTIANNVAPYIK